jgi:hypothetical protein
MQFELKNSFDANLALFRTEVEIIDSDCAKILFDNLAILCRDVDAARDRAAIADFHRAVLAALEQLPDPP